jgi:hypothetical protein
MTHDARTSAKALPGNPIIWTVQLSQRDCGPARTLSPISDWCLYKIKPLSEMDRRTTGMGPSACENGWLTLRYMGGQMTGDKVRRPIDSRQAAEATLGQ